MKNSILLYLQHYQAIKNLSNETLGKLFRCIFEYQLGNNVEIDEDINIAFNFINNQILLDNEKYKKKCQKLRDNAIKKSNATKCNQMQPNATKCNQIRSDNDNDNDNDNDKEKINKKEKQKHSIANEEDLSFQFDSINYDDELRNKEQQVIDFISKNDINITPQQHYEIVSKYLKYLEPAKINKALLLGNNKPFGYVRAILASWLVNMFNKEQVRKKVIPDWLNKDIESSAVIEENDYEFKEFIKEFRKK